MNRVAWIQRTRRALALPFVLLLVGILVVMGFTGHLQVSSTRKLFEKMYARRLALVVADSAFEEISAQLEQQLSNIPFPAERIYQNKNLQTELQWPSTLTANLTAEGFKDDNVELKPVEIKSSDWKTVTNPPIDQLKATLQSGQPAQAVVHEVGILELKVAVKMKIGSTSLEQTVTTRRYMAATVDSAGEQNAHLKIQPRNMVMMFPEEQF
jgi:hypothetical protein